MLEKGLQPIPEPQTVCMSCDHGTSHPASTAVATVIDRKSIPLAEWYLNADRAALANQRVRSPGFRLVARQQINRMSGALALFEIARQTWPGTASLSLDVSPDRGRPA